MKVNSHLQMWVLMFRNSLIHISSFDTTDEFDWWVQLGYIIPKLSLLLLLSKSLQLCPTLCDPIDGSPPGSPVPGILQARTLEWGAISFSNAWKWKVKVKSLSRVQLFATPWTAAYQAPSSMGFSRQEYWSGVPLPSPKLSLTARQWFCPLVKRKLSCVV